MDGIHLNRQRMNNQQKGSFNILVFLLVVIALFILFRTCENKSVPKGDACLDRQTISLEGEVVITGMDFMESSIFVEILAMILEDIDPAVRLDKKHNFGGNWRVFQLLLAGTSHIHIDYTGFLSSSIYNVSSAPSLQNAEALNSLRLGRVAENVRHCEYNIFDPFVIDNSYVLLMRRSMADSIVGRNKPITIGDLQALRPSDKIECGFSFDFAESPFRKDTWEQLVDYYGLRKADFIPRGLKDRTDIYSRLERYDFDIIDGYETDAERYSGQFVEIRDNDNFFPDYYLVPVVRQELIEKYPEIRKRLETLGQLLLRDDIARIIERLQRLDISIEDLVNDEGNQSALQKVIREVLRPKIDRAPQRLWR